MSSGGGIAPGTGTPAEPNGQPIEARTPSTGDGTGDPAAEGVASGAHPAGHEIEMAGICIIVGTAPTAGAVTTGIAGGPQLAPARAADAATGRGGSAARAG